MFQILLPYETIIFSHYIIRGFSAIKTTVTSLSVAAMCVCSICIYVYICICIVYIYIYTHDESYESDFYKIILNHFIPNNCFYLF